MSNKEKISTQEIIDLVAAKAMISKRASEEFLKGMIATIEEALLADESVKIKDFGTFKLQWNEPRKSVNIQTGDDIVIAGYYKVNFAPEASFKNLINEPFAHLEAVRLGNEEEDKPLGLTEDNTEEPILEPLNIFTEQASEIKQLLFEINALSIDSKHENETLYVEIEKMDNDHVDEEYEEFDDISDEEKGESEMLMDVNVSDEEQLFLIENKSSDDVNQPKDNADYNKRRVENETLGDDKTTCDRSIEAEAEEPVNEEEQALALDIADLGEQNKISGGLTENELEVFAFLTKTKEEESSLDNISHTPTKVEPAKFKKKRRTIWIPIIFVLIFLVSALSYIFFPPVTTFVHNSYVYYKENVSIADIFDNMIESIVPKKKKLAQPAVIVVPKDTLENVPAKDSLQILFDTPRVYPNFIASQRISRGSRLAWMSKKYYGAPDFWVYIYEANSDRFPNPDNISEGAMIHIPKLDPRLIDPQNPRCIDNAKKLHDLYVKK